MFNTDFKKASDQILSVFTKTLDSLNKLNDDIQIANSKKKFKIQVLEKEVQENNEVLENNLKVINKISNILE